MNFDGPAIEYQYTKRSPGETALTVVGPFDTVEAAREAIVRDLAESRPRMRRAKAEKFAAKLSPGSLARGVREVGPEYEVEKRPHVHPHDAKTLRTDDAATRHLSGVALVHPETLLSVMGERVPEYLKGTERDAYLEALCDIPIHLRDATLEHDVETGQLDWEPTRVQANAAVLGSRWDRTGAWGEA